MSGTSLSERVKLEHELAAALKANRELNAECMKEAVRADKFERELAAMTAHDAWQREQWQKMVSHGVGLQNRLQEAKAERDQWKATAEDYRIQACRPDECRAKVELAAFVRLLDPADGNVVAAMVNLQSMLAENKWHLASDPPNDSRNVEVIIESWFMERFKCWRHDGNDIYPTHWRELPQPPKGQP
jgi:hypothetical protein